MLAGCLLRDATRRTPPPLPLRILRQHSPTFTTCSKADGGVSQEAPLFIFAVIPFQRLEVCCNDVVMLEPWGDDETFEFLLSIHWISLLHSGRSCAAGLDFDVCENDVPVLIAFIVLRNKGRVAIVSIVMSRSCLPPFQMPRPSQFRRRHLV